MFYDYIIIRNTQTYTSMRIRTYNVHRALEVNEQQEWFLEVIGRWWWIIDYGNDI